MRKRENRVWRMGNEYWRQADREGLLEEVTLNGDLDGEGETQCGSWAEETALQRDVNVDIQGREKLVRLQ